MKLSKRIIERNTRVLPYTRTTYIQILGYFRITFWRYPITLLKEEPVFFSHVHLFANVTYSQRVLIMNLPRLTLTGPRRTYRLCTWNSDQRARIIFAEVASQYRWNWQVIQGIQCAGMVFCWTCFGLAASILWWSSLCDIDR